MNRNKKIAIGVVLLAIVVILSACTMKNSKDKGTTVDEPDTDQASVEWSETFQNSCITCHAIGDGGKVERISDIRKTPEGWQDTISRMQTMWGLQITDEEKAVIIQELSDKNGLAPEEMDNVMYWLTESGSALEPVTEHYGKIESACIACHAGGRPLAQYRTADEWMKLKDFHIGMNPSTIYQMRAVNWEQEAEEILSYLADVQAYDSAEWQAWKEAETNYEIEGTWRVVGYQPGNGLYSGYSKISRKDDMYFEKRSLLMPGDKKEDFEGNVRMYAGYSLRSSLSNGDKKIRGVFNVKEDGKIIEGRWNQVQDKGIFAEETYYKTDEIALLATWPSSIKTGTTETLHIIGTKLPDQLTPESFITSDGLVVEKVERQDGDDVWLTITANAKDNQTIALKSGGQHVNVLAFDEVDTIKVFPERGMARLNYTDYQQSVQFEAIGYTADNVEIGPLAVKWELDEHFETEKDDDLSYVGQLDPIIGLFTPAQGGPNPERFWSANNTGNVIAKAIYQDPTTKKQLIGESIIVVSVPDYMYIK